MLRAYNRSSGKDAGPVYMPDKGIPMTHMLDSKQNIVVAIGGQNYPSESVAFRLLIKCRRAYDRAEFLIGDLGRSFLTAARATALALRGPRLQD
jgi:hypothetical protein